MASDGSGIKQDANPINDPSSLNTNSSKKTNVKFNADFPVVGIGASAGGIEAVSSLLQALPGDLGVAYVIIQHLSPYHESALPEVLEKHTSMKVHKAGEGMLIEQNNVYVIPPNAYMSISDGHLTLSSPAVKNHISHPIDFFLIKLASAYQNNAIGVILSGTASDGTVGIQAIKAEGGITFAQDNSAMFAGMPKSAKDSGFVDFVLSPAEIAKEIIHFINLPFTGITVQKVLETNESDLRRIFQILRAKYNIDFSVYKSNTINRRILRRVALNRIKNFAEYINLLHEKNSEIDLLYHDLLINVTTFFRDAQLYQALGKKVFPSLFKDKKITEPVRVWIPACSTGEEAYSFAICLFEHLGDKAISAPIQIFATDLNERSIDKARTGIYNKSALQNISPTRLRRFFLKIDGSFQIIKPIRDICVFATHNLLQDPPFSRMDIISCQNVLIYIEPSSQKKILESFHYALKPRGFLLLGKSETIGSASNLFEQADVQFKIYTKKEVTGYKPFEFSVKRPSSYSTAEMGEEVQPESNGDLNIDKETERLLLARFVPASVVVNKELHIFRFHGATANYLQPASGKASLHLLKMVRDELVFELRGLLQKVKKEGQPIKKAGIQLRDNGNLREVTIEVLPIKASSREPHYLILFKEETGSNGTSHATEKPLRKISKTDKDKRIESLEQEIQEAREQMKSMSEEFEATREELQSANEEVLSSNEELQSINEELETSKEELQSTNEELTTINEELLLRNADLKETVEYAETIVETIREPLVLLNGDLRVRTANKAFYSAFNLLPEHTEGYFFYDMKNGLWNIPELRKQLSNIVNKNKSFEDFEVTHTFKGLGEKILVFNATRMLQDDNKKSKFLLAIEDVTERRKAEKALKESLYLNTTILNSISDIFISIDNNWNFIYANQQAEKFIGKVATDVLGKNIWEILGKYKGSEIDAKLNEAMKGKASVEFEFFEDNNKHWYHCRIYPSPEGLSIYCNNITQQKQLEQHLKESEETFRLLVQNGFDIITIYSEDGTIKYQSDSLKHVLGYEPKERIGKNIFSDPLIHPEDAQLKENMFRNAKEHPGRNIKGEFRLRDRDGTYKNMEYVCRNLLADARVNGIVANYRDITERKLLEKQKEEFIAIASHELKTPVTSIKAYAEILEDVFTASKDGESEEMVKKLGNQVDRLTNLVKDLLDVTKITEGQLKLVEDYYDINEAILETVEDMQLTTKKHTIVTQLDPADRLWGDRSRIEQVLVNLISNAIKYSPEAEKVIITSKADEEGVTISVEDFGIGLSKEVQQQIFERFYRVSGTEANTFPGLGLGLYISTEVIRRQGGRIWVTSEQNKGSVFGFFLPYKRP